MRLASSDRHRDPFGGDPHGTHPDSGAPWNQPGSTRPRPAGPAGAADFRNDRPRQVAAGNPAAFGPGPSRYRGDPERSRTGCRVRQFARPVGQAGAAVRMPRGHLVTPCGKPPERKKGAPRGAPSCRSRKEQTAYIMPSMPPMPPGMPPAAAPFGSGLSATMASVVISRPATEAASSRAVRVTFAGSMTPNLNMSPYSSVWV